MPRMKNKDSYITKRLSCIEVIDIAKKVAGALKIKLPSDNELLARFNIPIPLPLMLKNDIVQLWVDKYYIAYSFHDEDEVNYCYITKHHIREEERSYCNRPIPKNIRKDFNEAKAEMTKSEKIYAILEKRIVKFM
jgi:hypothetical protein